MKKITIMIISAAAMIAGCWSCTHEEPSAESVQTTRMVKDVYISDYNLISLGDELTIQGEGWLDSDVIVLRNNEGEDVVKLPVTMTDTKICSIGMVYLFDEGRYTLWLVRGKEEQWLSSSYFEWE